MSPAFRSEWFQRFLSAMLEREAWATTWDELSDLLIRVSPVSSDGR